MKKLLGAITVTVLASIVTLAGCKGKNTVADSGKVSIMFQGSDAEQAAIKATTERFTQKTGIEVELLYTPHDSYTEKLAGYISNKDMPDIISIDGPNLASLAWGGHITSIEDYIDKDVIADMTKSNVEQCTYPVDKKLYAIGAADSTVLLYCNRKYLNEINARIPTSVNDAWTVEEFDDILAKLSKLPEVKWPLDIMWAWNIAGSEWGTYGFYECLTSAGSDLIDRTSWKTDGTLNNEAAVKTLTYFQRWNKNGWIVPKSAGDNTLYNDKRETAIAWNGNWAYQAIFAAMGDDAVAVPLPNFGKGTRTPNATWIWGITATSKNKKEAGQLLSFMMKDTQWMDALKAVGAYPALKSFAARCEDYNDPSKMAIAYEQSNYAVSRPLHPAYPTITLEFANAFESVLNGTDAKAALDKAAKAIDADITDNDGYPPFGKQ
ncbi:MAG TPA: ABC transporter substrate-binding protein [Treponema sp.]|nr:ABC transporter substrate-binding protein [Treponema sp.]